MQYYVIEMKDITTSFEGVMRYHEEIKHRFSRFAATLLSLLIDKPHQRAKRFMIR